MATVRYFWHGLIHRGTAFICLRNSLSPYLLPFTKCLESVVHHQRVHFVDLLYWPPCITDKFISCVVASPSQWFFHFGEEIVIAWTLSGEYGGCSRITHCQRRKRSMTAAGVRLLALLWRMMGFCTTKYRRFLLSQCDYYLFAKVKEPLRGTRYNTRGEIRSIERLIRKISKNGRADGVWRLPNI